LLLAVAVVLTLGAARLLWVVYSPSGWALAASQPSEEECTDGQMVRVDRAASTDAGFDGLATLPASVVEYRWTGSASDGEALYSIANYSHEGALSRRTYYGPAAAIEALESYTRDNTGRLAERRFEDDDGNLLKVHKLVYSDQGVFVGEIVTDSSGNVIERVERARREGAATADPGGQNVDVYEEKVFSASGELAAVRVRVEDEWGNPVSVTDYAPDGTLLLVTEYEYNKDSWDNWIERREYHVVPGASRILVAGASRYVSYPGAG
jgi:hypothetical protein